MRKISLIITVLFFTTFITAQDIPIGGWQEHLSYKAGLSVTEGNGKVYCATESGIFSYKKSDNSMDRMSKVSGLSDVEAVVLNFNAYNNKLLIAYKNSNLDMIESNNSIINIADIKNKPLVGNKSINNIYFIDQFAYLACGFGIVVIDMSRDEVKDTYYIGPGGSTINVRDITSDGRYIYAATDAGIYKASLSNPNLANFSAWSIMSGIHTGIYNTIASFNGKIYANYSKNLMTGAYGQDSIRIYDTLSATWSYYTPSSGYIVYSIRNNYNQLVITMEGSIVTYNSSFVGSGYYSGYFSDLTRAKTAVLDNSGSIWIADSKYGLVSWRPGEGYRYRYPNGPSSYKTYNMNLSDNKLFVVPGSKATYFADGVYTFANDEWTNIKGNYPSVVGLDSVYDLMDVVIDPKNSKRAFATSWGLGLLEFYNNTPIKLYNESNSSLRRLPGTYDPLWVYGIAMDANENLWVTNSGVPNSISVKSPGGAWNSLNFAPLLGSSPYLDRILVDKNDQKWAIVTDGLLVYKGGATSAVVPGVNAKKLTTSAGDGALPSPNVFAMAEDKDGEIWVGTDKGIAVFYSPENVFTGGSFDSQQILLEQDGHVQILLLTETIQDIAVDDANQKWIATVNSGVFLMSADGTKQVEHFDESNSPLFSNNVKSIAINHATGEVYFGTAKGIISYRGKATAGNDSFTDVYAFPNPVKHDYSGPITIKGLVDNTTLKITDVSGTLVYETKSEGGQAFWYGKNFKDERVSTGVYIVFCTSDDGTQKTVTKILVIN